MNNALHTMPLPKLVGSSKQIAFAEKIRGHWFTAQVEIIENELKIVAGEAVVGVDLTEGTDPKSEDLRDAFVGIVDRRIKTLRTDMAQTSAKAWINGLQGQWVLNFGPMARK